MLGRVRQTGETRWAFLHGEARLADTLVADNRSAGRWAGSNRLVVLVEPAGH